MNHMLFPEIVTGEAPFTKRLGPLEVFQKLLQIDILFRPLTEAKEVEGFDVAQEIAESGARFFSIFQIMDMAKNFELIESMLHE